MPLYRLTKALIFPAAENALDDPDGLLATGGDLSLERLQLAYRSGIFPWFNQEDPILWWSPDPRAVFYPDKIHISRSLKKIIRKMPYRITLNHNFPAVIYQCASIRQEGTWISPAMQSAYIALHQNGIAHSVEVWHGDQLVGGLYGIGMGKIFCGESMFSKQDNASKFAFIALTQHLCRYDFKLIDSQILNEHTASLGATEIARAFYLTLLNQYRDILPEKTCWQKQILVITH